MEKPIDVCWLVPYITGEEINKRTKSLGQEITKDYIGKDLVLVCVLKGSFVFTSDLVRQINLPLEMEFIAVKSYDKDKSTGSVQITQHLTSPIDNKHILLVEDIVDTGTTSKFLIDLLEAHRPSSVKLCSLLYKPSKIKTPVKIDYLGFEIPDIFVVGYGLDYDQKYRNLPYIANMED